MLLLSVLTFKSTRGSQYCCPCANCYLVIRAMSRFTERVGFLVHTDICFSEYAERVLAARGLLTAVWFPSRLV